MAKNRSAAAAAAGAVARRAVSSTSPPSSTGSAAKKPAARAAGSMRRERRAVAQQQLRPALQRRVLLGAPQSTISAGTAPSASSGVGAVPAGLARRRAAARRRGSRLARHDDEPVAAARLGRRRVGRAARRVLVPAAAGLAAVPAGARPSAPPAATGASAARRSDCSKNERATAKPTSIPTRSISSNGPIRKPPARRQIRSTCSGVASRSCTIRSASSQNGRLQRLTRKPGASAAAITCLPIASPTARARASAAARARRAGDDLDEPHLRRRVEEVHADDALGAGYAGRDRASRQRRRVGREDRVGRDDAAERANSARLSSRSSGAASITTPQGARAPSAAPHSTPGDGPPRHGVGIVQHHAQARVARCGGDPGAHRPGAGDPERRPVEVHGGEGTLVPVPVAMELFSLVMIAIFVGFLGGILLLGFYSPRSGADVLNWRPTRSPAAESQNEIDVVELVALGLGGARRAPVEHRRPRSAASRGRAAGSRRGTPTKIADHHPAEQRHRDEHRHERTLRGHGARPVAARDRRRRDDGRRDRRRRARRRACACCCTTPTRRRAERVDGVEWAADARRRSRRAAS